MKKIKILLSAFLVLAFIFSCEEDNLDPIGEWDLSEPSLLTTNETLVLNENQPDETFEFTWDPAISTERYQVRYTLILSTPGNYEDPLLSKASENGGRDTNGSFTASEMDLALSYAGFEAGKEVDLEITVLAKSIDKQTTDSVEVSVKRFETEYLPEQLFLSGEATEAGSDLSQALSLRSLKDADNNPTNVFEIYTHLEAGAGFKIYSESSLPAHIYGGSEGNLVKNGDPIMVAETGEYRLTVDLAEGTYNLQKIDHLSVVGDVIAAGWGGDEPLEYQANGVWEAQLSLNSGGFLFRLNGDWGYLFKRIVGTQNEIYMESQAGDAGIEIEDLSLDAPGDYTVTVDLSGDTYTYSLESNQVSNPPSETPDALYLLADGEVVFEFNKEDDKFMSGTYIPLQAEVIYELNSAIDGTGTAYSLDGIIGETSNPDGDSAFGSLGLLESPGDISPARDQAYSLEFNFATGAVNWKYYNIKLFHWDEEGGGWDSRDEFLMTYVHPHKFTTTQALEAGYNLKFNSPWDIQLGADDPEALSGTMTNGGPNFTNITTSGTYEVNIEVSNDYETGTYEFILQ
ncbi:MAG: SusE domain-containing protein [Salegentibacter sp.]|uniref:SusE domain-containing protein n=1 Tax=Salegentibacter sp. TaxID=1903072 RepID=UPI002870498F|nr:SusE domain-containing protein [Salegentibacter sp.]MDR9458325.1 SusE domain-containing protein [Salegentibacter sp.]